MIDSGDTAWLIVATALVQLMTPGLAFFYGGMVSHKAAITTMMMSFGTSVCDSAEFYYAIQLGV